MFENCADCSHGMPESIASCRVWCEVHEEWYNESDHCMSYDERRI
jgi:hypothetical protein